MFILQQKCNNHLDGSYSTYRCASSPSASSISTHSVLSSPALLSCTLTLTADSSLMELLLYISLCQLSQCLLDLHTLRAVQPRLAQLHTHTGHAGSSAPQSSLLGQVRTHRERSRDCGGQFHTGRACLILSCFSVL